MSFESSVERPVIIGMGNDRGISLRELYCGARRGNRTPMTVRSADFESAASACSAIRAKEEFIKFFEKKTREVKFCLRTHRKFFFRAWVSYWQKRDFASLLKVFPCKEDA